MMILTALKMMTKEEEEEEEAARRTKLGLSQTI